MPRFQTDGWLGEEDGKLIVTVDDQVAGFVGWSPYGHGAGRYRSIGAVLLPECRRRGVETQAQLLLGRYLFAHTAVHRIEAVRAVEVGEPFRQALVQVKRENGSRKRR